MPLSDYERQILAQLEVTFAEDSVRLSRLEQTVRRRWWLAGIAVPIALVAGLVLSVVGVGLGGSTGVALAVVAYLLLVAAGHVAVTCLRRVRAAGRLRRPQRSK